MRVDRLYTLLQERMTRQQVIWGENLTVFDDPAAAQLPLVLRRARAFERVLLEMPVAIEADDLIVGLTMQDGVIVRTRMSGYATAEEHDRAGQEGASLAAQLAHKTPYYSDVLEKGLSGIMADIDARLADIARRPQSQERDDKLALFRAMRLECEAVIALANRYADLAQALSKRAGTARRHDELLKIAEVCRRVPEFPARTFYEAVQSFWFIHYAFFSTGTNISCGRLDQFLSASLRHQLDADTITLEQAQELVDCLWLRFNDRGQICRENFFVEEADSMPDTAQRNDGASSKVPRLAVVVNSGPQEWAAGHRKRFRYAADAGDAINHFGQNLLLGGIQPDGSDGTNELTYLCLNALEKFALTSPVVTVRLHKNSPRVLVTRAAEVLKQGSGMPYINNDDVIVQAYSDLGVPLEDARDYANSNCWETMIQGKSDQELIRGMNFLLFLELALNRGRSRVHGQMGPDTGDPRGFACFQELMDAWKVQLDFQLEQGMDYIGSGVASRTLEHSGHGKYSYNPLLSALTLDCLQNEQDVIRGGARYTIWHVMGEAVANTIDAVAAIKKMVFEDQSLSMDEILAALGADWEGHEDLRRRLIARAPKYANDKDDADDIGREMMAYFVDRTRFHAARHPAVIFPCSVGTFSWYAMIGKEVGATPDGRHDGEAIAANFSPVPGADMSGPTAAINSYLKMPVAALAAGAPLDLRLSAGGLQGDAGTQRLAGLLSAFVALGGNMLTLTVTDVEELKRAMQEPEKYRHLRVRMGGWSAYFVMLGEEQQRLHIKRVEHGLV
jgi:formate C-acetyltransferase